MLQEPLNKNLDDSAFSCNFDIRIKRGMQEEFDEY
jgi:hypothetical protein